MIDKLFRFMWNLGQAVVAFIMIAYACQMIKEMWICVREIYEHFFPPSEESLRERERRIQMKIKTLLENAVAKTKIRRERIKKRDEKAYRNLLGPNFKI